jgi:hypothetical protein
MTKSYNALFAMLAALEEDYTKAQFPLVLGNHEFYGLDYETGIAEAVRMCGKPVLEGKVVLLHIGRWDVPDSRTPRCWAARFGPAYPKTPTRSSAPR